MNLMNKYKCQNDTARNVWIFRGVSLIFGCVCPAIFLFDGFWSIIRRCFTHLSRGEGDRSCRRNVIFSISF